MCTLVLNSSDTVNTNGIKLCRMLTSLNSLLEDFHHFCYTLRKRDTIGGTKLASRFLENDSSLL